MRQLVLLLVNERSRVGGYNAGGGYRTTWPIGARLTMTTADMLAPAAQYLRMWQSAMRQARSHSPVGFGGAELRQVPGSEAGL